MDIAQVEEKTRYSGYIWRSRSVNDLLAEQDINSIYILHFP